MKTPLILLAIVGVFLLGFYLFAPAPDLANQPPRTDLPWQVKIDENGNSRVFGIVLGETTLAGAMEKFGGLEGLAVFAPKDSHWVLEGYFGTVPFGPLNAKVIVGLEADDAELQTLLARASGREGSPSGDWKYPLMDEPQMHADRRLNVITYVPGTRNLDQDFIRDRFGEPAATLQENDKAVSWFYPRLGLSILIDQEAREVFEYQPVRDFSMPTGVTLNPAY